MYEIENIRINNNKAVLRFNDITPEDSERLIGKELYLPLELLPSLGGNRFYFHEVTGFEVRDVNFGLVGMLTEVLDTAPQALFSIDHQGKEVLVPIIDEIIVEINRPQKQILIKAPAGLIEIYLE
jgi:16S rRNA processing protein RimM